MHLVILKFCCNCFAGVEQPDALARCSGVQWSNAGCCLAFRSFSGWQQAGNNLAPSIKIHLVLTLAGREQVDVLE
jgi:hypothetical protein